jgi:hypothetical protein
VPLIAVITGPNQPPTLVRACMVVACEGL